MDPIRQPTHAHRHDRAFGLAEPISQICAAPPTVLSGLRVAPNGGSGAPRTAALPTGWLGSCPILAGCPLSRR
jgi:hypothetical protein